MSKTKINIISLCGLSNMRPSKTTLPVPTDSAEWKLYMQKAVDICSVKSRLIELESSAAPTFQKVKDLSPAQISQYLKYKSAGVDLEAGKFTLLMGWLKADLPGRSSSVSELLQEIDLPGIFQTHRLVLENEFEHGLLSDNVGCLKVYMNLLKQPPTPMPSTSTRSIPNISDTLTRPTVQQAATSSRTVRTSSSPPKRQKANPASTGSQHDVVPTSTPVLPSQPEGQPLHSSPQRQVRKPPRSNSSPLKNSPSRVASTPTTNSPSPRTRSQAATNAKKNSNEASTPRVSRLSASSSSSSSSNSSSSRDSSSASSSASPSPSKGTPTTNTPKPGSNTLPQLAKRRGRPVGRRGVGRSGTTRRGGPLPRKRMLAVRCYQVPAKRAAQLKKLALEDQRTSSAQSSSPEVRETRGSRSSGGANNSDEQRDYLFYENQERRGRFLYRFDWQTKQSTQLYKFETPREYSATVAIGNELYDLGGTEVKFKPKFGDSGQGSNCVEIFGIGGDRFRRHGPPMLEKRKEFPSCFLDGYLYVIGGCFSDSATNCCERLNVSEQDSLEEWERLPFLVEPKGAHTVVTVDDKIFAIGGIGRETFSSVEMYDGGPRWTHAAPLTDARGRHASVVLDGQVFVCGGENENEDAIKTCELYDPEINRWTSLPSMNHDRLDFNLSVVGGRILAIGGTSDETPKEIDAYDPREGRWELVPWERALHSTGSFYNAVSLRMRAEG